MDYYSADIQKNARTSDFYDTVTKNLTKCPFCDLKNKYFIYEGSFCVLTVNLFPYIDGHLMVIPKRHVEKFSDMTNDEWLEIKNLINIGIRAIKNELHISNTNVLYREGGGAGASLGHMHIHILPITSEFMKGDKKKFTWEYQDVKLAPVDMAERLRNYVTL